MADTVSIYYLNCFWQSFTHQFLINRQKSASFLYPRFNIAVSTSSEKVLRAYPLSCLSIRSTTRALLMTPSSTADIHADADIPYPGNPLVHTKRLKSNYCSLKTMISHLIDFIFLFFLLLNSAFLLIENLITSDLPIGDAHLSILALIGLWSLKIPDKKTT